MIYQICRICGESKELTKFRKDKYYKNGYGTICAECSVKYQTKRNKKFKDKMLGKNRPCSNLEINSYLFARSKGQSFKQISKDYNRDEDFIIRKIQEVLTAKQKPMKSYLKYA